jgi:uncharacterized integral membrane protein
MSPLLYVRYVYKLTDFDVRIQVYTKSRRGILELLLVKSLLLLLLLLLFVVVATTNNYKDISLRVWNTRRALQVSYNEH